VLNAMNKKKKPVDSTTTVAVFVTAMAVGWIGRRSRVVAG